MSQDSPPQRDPQGRAIELALHAAVFVAVALVMLPVFLHPGDVLYSEQSDLLSQHHPFRHLQMKSFHDRGTPLLWNPTSFGGGPLIGDPQAGIFYPPNWLHALAHPDDSAAWFGWVFVLHLLVGGYGVLWWLRGHGFGPGSRLAGAVVFMFCGKWFYHVAFPGHMIFLPFMWVPWQLGALDRIGSRSSLPAAVGFAALTALCITGLHPQLLLYSQLVVLGYALAPGGPLFRRTTPPPLRPTLLIAGAGVLGLALAAAHLLPIVESLDFFVRGDGVPYAEAAQRAVNSRTWPAFFLPGRIDVTRWEHASFVGVLAAALALFAPWRRERRTVVLYFSGCTIACMVYAFGEPGRLHLLAHQSIPGFDLFRYPTRMLLVLGLPLAYLSAAGLEVLCGNARPRGPALLATLLVAGAAGLVYFQPSAEAAMAALALSAPAIALLSGSSAALDGRLSALRPAALVLLLFVDQARFALPLVRTRSMEEALGSNPLVERLRSPYGAGRVLGMNLGSKADYSAIPVTYATPGGIEGMRGFNPLVPIATYVYLQAGAGQNKELDWEPGTTIYSFPLKSRKHLDLFNVRWIVSNQLLDVPGLEIRERYQGLEIYQFQRPEALGRLRNTRLYENTRSMPRAALVRGARFVEDRETAVEVVLDLDPHEEILVEDRSWVGTYPGTFREVPVIHEGDELSLSVDVDGGAFLLISEVWYPGWLAEVDGEATPIARANGIFQALRLDAGQHEIRLRYRPHSYTLGLAISGGALLLSLALLAAHRLRTRRD
ncbi:MAG: YfhO family protein [Deltaproteobacteria bacterium]|nr:YfhO family protein [Deltaproteobacteria bacterium]